MSQYEKYFMKISIIIVIITANIKNQQKNQRSAFNCQNACKCILGKKMQHFSGEQLGIQLHAPHSVLPGSMLVDHTTILPFL